MYYYFWVFVFFLARLIFSLRYKIEIKGLEKLESKKKTGLLFLPNHTAHLDPLIIFMWIWPKFQMRPLVAESIFQMSWLQPLIKLTKGIPIPDFEKVNQLKVKRAQIAFGKVRDALKSGDNIVIFPSGKFKSQGKEIVGGASGAHDLIEQSPEINVVLVRLTGLWGSSFSKALTGASPDPFDALMHGIKILLKNGIFFTPRRKISVEFEIPGDLPRKGSRIEFNTYLENWYNRYPDEEGKIHESEPLKLVSYSFWRKVFPEVTRAKKDRLITKSKAISSQTRNKVYAAIQKILESPSLKISSEMTLGKDLGMDSLNIAELIAFLSQQYDVENVHPEDLETVQNVLEIAEGARRSEIPNSSLKSAWPQESRRPEGEAPVGRTFPEVFLNTAKRMNSFSAVGDDVVGVWNYKKLKKGALVLAQYFRTMPEDHIAIMLPASNAAYLLVLAIQFAGKIPVMLNWTLGPRYLEQMMALTSAKKVITSMRFLDKLSHVDFGSLIDSIETLEDIRFKLTLKMKLRGVYLTLLSTRAVLTKLKLGKIDENEPAVILFTSGTEASPKGVPLSHKNLLANIRSGLRSIDIGSTDVVFSFLPPFHSFGFTVSGFLPIFCGIRLAFSPDPTDSFALAAGAEKWKATHICSAPSFLKGLLAAAKPEQLQSLRYFIVGAEKAPKELFDQIKHTTPNASLIEGYGITECSPGIAINRSKLPKVGVGPALPDVDICTIHLENQELLADGQEGEICIHGESVFNGYLGGQKSPFITIEGKRWYRTGDIGFLDENKNLTLSGRLKRFTKIGGEMISLGAIEEALAKELISRKLISSDLPSIALCADETESGKPKLILYTIFPIEKESVNEILIRSGFSNLVKISSVQRVEEIPLMATGKTNYRQLQQPSRYLP